MRLINCKKIPVLNQKGEMIQPVEQLAPPAAPDEEERYIFHLNTFDNNVENYLCVDYAS
jgi:hypothetical protein